MRGISLISSVRGRSSFVRAGRGGGRFYDLNQGFSDGRDCESVNGRVIWLIVYKSNGLGGSIVKRTDA